MSSRDIVEDLAKKGILEQMIRKATGGVWRPEHKDLTQDLLLELLDMPEEKLLGLYNRNQLPYFLTRIVKNNIHSKTSRFFYRYRKFLLRSRDADKFDMVDLDTEDE